MTLKQNSIKGNIIYLIKPTFLLKTEILKTKITKTLCVQKLDVKEVIDRNRSLN